MNGIRKNSESIRMWVYKMCVKHFRLMWIAQKYTHNWTEWNIVGSGGKESPRCLSCAGRNITLTHVGSVIHYCYYYYQFCIIRRYYFSFMCFVPSKGQHIIFCFFWYFPSAKFNCLNNSIYCVYCCNINAFFVKISRVKYISNFVVYLYLRF